MNHNAALQLLDQVMSTTTLGMVTHFVAAFALLIMNVAAEEQAMTQVSLAKLPVSILVLECSVLWSVSWRTSGRR